MPKEPDIPPRVVGGGFPGPDMGKATADIEMGRKPVSDDTAFGEGELGWFSNDDGLDKDGGFENASPVPDLSRSLPTEGTELRSTLHPRRSSWGRRSGSWDISPEVVAMASQLGNSNQINGASNNLTGSHQ